MPQACITAIHHGTDNYTVSKTRHRRCGGYRPNVIHCFAANLTAFPAVKEFEDRLIT